ncbi:hypothetical protein CC78DRAFT_583324 [Lojkania enalia]|uniref:Uncharacterized protein n=1 Tax=Lojkania enalia TaxID=147567 RepID=A0A9P4K835_9PLEO|nr:hypothetical protein CC78DRAFT_583324 [Didymosphaeria enalia]
MAPPLHSWEWASRDEGLGKPRKIIGSRSPKHVKSLWFVEQSDDGRYRWPMAQRHHFLSFPAPTGDATGRQFASNYCRAEPRSYLGTLCIHPVAGPEKGGNRSVMFSGPTRIQIRGRRNPTYFPGSPPGFAGQQQIKEGIPGRAHSLTRSTG